MPEAIVAGCSNSPHLTELADHHLNVARNAQLVVQRDGKPVQISQALPEPNRLAAACENCIFIASSDPKLEVIAVNRSSDGVPPSPGGAITAQNWL